MENLEFLISESLFLGLASLGEGRQGISRSISFSLTIIDLKVVLKKLSSLVDLTRTQAFYIHELIEVIIVSKDEDLIFVAFKVVTPSLESFNNSQKLLIESFILSLNGNHLLREKGYWVPLANFGFRIEIFVGHMTRRILIRGHLTKDPTNSIPRSISLHPNMTLWIKMP